MGGEHILKKGKGLLRKKKQREKRIHLADFTSQKKGKFLGSGARRRTTSIPDKKTADVWGKKGKTSQNVVQEQQEKNINGLWGKTWQKGSVVKVWGGVEALEWGGDPNGDGSSIDSEGCLGGKKKCSQKGNFFTKSPGSLKNGFTPNDHSAEKK